MSKISMLTHLGKLAQRYRTDGQGNVALIFAMVATPIIGMVGFGADFMLAERDRTIINGMADSAVLAAVNKTTVDTTLTWPRQQQRSYDAMKNHFEASLTEAPMARGKIKSINYTVELIDGAVQAKLCYTAEQETILGNLLGISEVDITGCAAATSASPRFVEVHFLVDASGSMGIGASSADQTLMQARLGCAFACHTLDWRVPSGNPAPVCDNPYNDWTTGRASPTCAAYIGAKTRFDIVKGAINSILDDAENIQKVPRQFVFGVHKFSNYLTTVRTAHHAIPAVRNDVRRMTMDDLGAGTNLRVALTDLNRKLPVSGDGQSENNRKVFLILITDGVEGNVFEKKTYGPQGLNFYSSWDPDPNLTINTPGFWDGPERSQVIDAASCAAIKQKGIEVMTLNAEYLTPAGSTEFRFQQIQNMLVPQIRRTMEDCASRPQYAFNAATPGEIELATMTMFKSVLETARLTQ